MIVTPWEKIDPHLLFSLFAKLSQKLTPFEKNQTLQNALSYAYLNQLTEDLKKAVTTLSEKDIFFKNRWRSATKILENEFIN